FTGKSSFKGGTVSMSFMSSASLPNAVNQLSGDIDWSVATKDDGTFSAGASWGHKLYVTYGEPTGSPVTEKRVDYVTSAPVAGKSGETACVDAVFDKMKPYHYAVGTPPPSPRWEIFGGTRADCGNLADAFRLACLMLGLPDKFKKGFVFPLANKGGAKFDTDEGASTARTNTGAHLAQHGSKEILVFRDQNGLNNRYEGCIVYNETYYCIGEDRFKSPEEVMNAMVITTFWGYTKDGAEELCKNPGPAPVARWQ
ncbi:MAG TPA: hypothetical protein VFQ51_20555, partial [Vicinamibacteria bacterium]|nr:hypothetical protein [Vicinamibacteria bacterium]